MVLPVGSRATPACFGRWPLAGGAKLDRSLASRFPLRILLAEDNPVNQKMAVRLLERLGYRVDAVGNGLEVLEALQRQPYDVVLMDVQMPEMDGLEATRRILSSWTSSERPWLIALTAGAMKENRAECKAAGLDDFLTKPINVRELEIALEHGYAECMAREPRDSEKMGPRITAGSEVSGTRAGLVVEV